MRRSKKLMKELHEELWLGWLARDPRRKKHTWPRWKKNGGDFYSQADCFACDYTEQGNTSCQRCPLDFPGREKLDPDSPAIDFGGCLGGLYHKWQKSTGENRVIWAKIIGMLPLYKEKKNANNKVPLQ